MSLNKLFRMSLDSRLTPPILKSNPPILKKKPSLIKEGFLY